MTTMLPSMARRHIQLRGSYNLRDLGGYASSFGGAVRWGRVYRAGRLDELTADDVRTLRGLELAVVYDLRTADERSHAPDAIPTVHLPVLAADRVEDLPLSEVDDREGGVRFLTEMSLRMLRHAGPEIGAVMFTLADPAATPMMFHCTAGKDRTGLLAALILELLGVDRADILDDYEMSAGLHQPSHIRSMLDQFASRGIPTEAAAGLMSSPREVMRDVLRQLDGEFGGIERYLAERGGVDRGAVAAIRRSLVA